MFHIAFIVTLVASSLLLLIPWQRTNRAIKIRALLLFVGQVVVVILSTISGSIVPRNHSALFVVIAFGLFEMGIALCAAVLWIRHWPSAEKENPSSVFAFEISVA